MSELVVIAVNWCA